MPRDLPSHGLGFALAWTGLLRPNSVIAMMMQNFAAMGLITVMWFLFVFSLCFGHTYYFVGSITTFGAFNNVDGAPLFRDTINGTHDGGTVVSDIPCVTAHRNQDLAAP